MFLSVFFNYNDIKRPLDKNILRPYEVDKSILNVNGFPFLWYTFIKITLIIINQK
jgi:hypothetical protein